MLKSKIKFSSESFYTQFKINHIPTNSWQKLQIAVKMGLDSLADPTKGYAVAALADVTSKVTLQNIHKQMKQDPIGRQILHDKPLLDIKNINIHNLAQLPQGTVGNSFGCFLKSYEDHLTDREPTHFIDDPELSYIMTRYRQLHDFSHLAYGIGTSVEAEITLKCIELIQTRLPMTLLAVLLGPLACPSIRTFKPSSANSDLYKRTENYNSLLEVIEDQTNYNKTVYPRKILLTKLIPWALSAAEKIRRPMHLIYIEKWMDQKMEAFREHCGIEIPPPEIRRYLE